MIRKDWNLSVAHEGNFSLISFPIPLPMLIAHIVLNFAHAVFWCCKVGFDALNCIRLTCHVKETSLVKFLNVFPCFLVNMVLVEIK